MITTNSNATGSATRPTPSNAIAGAAALIGIVSAAASGTLGYAHAKSAYAAATGSSAGFGDYLDVGDAFWDGLPIAAAVAVVVGLLAAGQYVSVAMLRFGAGLVGLMALAVGSHVDPARHLAAYTTSIGSGARDTAGFFSVWFTVYGPLAGILACIAGAGVGYAAGTKIGEP